MSTTSPRAASTGVALMLPDSQTRESREAGPAGNARSTAMLEPHPSPSQAEPVDRSKLVSPTPAASTSMTPPPSSQVPPAVKVPASRTPTPAANNFLASPPATTTTTTQAGQQHADADAAAAASSALVDPPSTARVDSASVEELRRMVRDLTLALSEARTSAAHYKLQFNMLQMESRETQNRMAVELDMAHREVDVLQAAEERRKNELASPEQAAAADANNAHTLLNDMTAQCSQLQHENARLHELVASLDRDLLQRSGEVDDKTAEIKRLRERIRQNRDHITGFLDNLSESSPRSLFAATPPHHRTPNRHGTPRHPAAIPRPSRPAILENNPGLEAILLADKVLSQEDQPPPSTPRGTSLKPRGHTRATQSLSSLPSTPSRRPGAASAGDVPGSTPTAVLRTPPHHHVLSAILDPPLAPQPRLLAKPIPGPAPGLGPAPGPGFSLAAAPQGLEEVLVRGGKKGRRRGSSDSTITASSVEGDGSAGRNAGRIFAAAAAAAAGEEEDEGEEEDRDSDEVPESRASMVATSMLRATPIEKGGSARSSFQSVNSGSGGGGGGLVQGRIVGKVIKSGISSSSAAAIKTLGKGVEMSPEKRRLATFGEQGQGSPTKKSRMDGVGLGIGIAGSPRK